MFYVCFVLTLHKNEGYDNCFSYKPSNGGFNQYLHP